MFFSHISPICIWLIWYEFKTNLQFDICLYSMRFQSLLEYYFRYSISILKMNPFIQRLESLIFPTRNEGADVLTENTSNRISSPGLGNEINFSKQKNQNRFLWRLTFRTTTADDENGINNNRRRRWQFLVVVFSLLTSKTHNIQMQSEEIIQKSKLLLNKSMCLFFFYQFENAADPLRTLYISERI